MITVRHTVVKSEEERYVLGEVYFPDREDTGHMFMDAATLRRTAHNFLMNGYVDKIDRDHDRTPTGNLVAESFIVRGDNDPDGFVAGAWVLGVYILNDEDWASIKRGDFNGWSLAGDAEIRKVSASVDLPVRMYGSTETHPDFPSSDHPLHSHEIDVSFSADGKVIPGLSSFSNGHAHAIVKTTATGEAAGHSHRIIIDIEE